jgi:hypothetical protein
VRAALQKVLILGKAPLPIRFRRTFALEDNRIVVTDEVRAPRSLRWRRLSAGTDATSIYVANSNTFQESRLLPWRHFPEAVKALAAKGTARMRRVFEFRG